MTADRPLRLDDLLRALDAHGVDFVIIGGIAVGMHGHVRATKDLDVMIEPSPANIERLWRFIEDVGAEPLALDDFRPDELPLPFEPRSFLEGGNWLLRTSLGRLDVMQYADGAPPYADLAARSLLGDLPGLEAPVRVCSLDDLLAMKRAADRAIDRGDIERLEQAHGLDSA
jgi:hypothetical protein